MSRTRRQFTRGWSRRCGSECQWHGPGRDRDGRRCCYWRFARSRVRRRRGRCGFRGRCGLVVWQCKRCRLLTRSRGARPIALRLGLCSMYVRARSPSPDSGKHEFELRRDVEPSRRLYVCAGAHRPVDLSSGRYAGTDSDHLAAAAGYPSTARLLNRTSILCARPDVLRTASAGKFAASAGAIVGMLSRPDRAASQRELSLSPAVTIVRSLAVAPIG